LRKWNNSNRWIHRIFKARGLVDSITSKAIEETTGDCIDKAHLPECEKPFKVLF